MITRGGVARKEAQDGERGVRIIEIKKKIWFLIGEPSYRQTSYIPPTSPITLTFPKFNYSGVRLNPGTMLPSSA